MAKAALEECHSAPESPQSNGSLAPELGEGRLKVQGPALEAARNRIGLLRSGGSLDRLPIPSKLVPEKRPGLNSLIENS